MKITLRPSELQLAGALAVRRLQQAKKNRLIEHGPPETWELHLYGVKGELAFSAMTGLRNTGDRIDLSDFPGYELKTRTRPTADLIIKPHHIETQKPSMVYVLAHTMFEADWVEFLGWITLGDFIEHPETRPFTSTNLPAFILDQKHLNPIKDLPCLRN